MRPKLSASSDTAGQLQRTELIDGAKALRAAIEEVFGTGQPVQRCRNHKMRNVIDELPKEQRPQAMNLMRAAWRVHDAY